MFSFSFNLSVALGLNAFQANPCEIHREQNHLKNREQNLSYLFHRHVFPFQSLFALVLIFQMFLMFLLLQMLQKGNKNDMKYVYIFSIDFSFFYEVHIFSVALQVHFLCSFSGV